MRRNRILALAASAAVAGFNAKLMAASGSWTYAGGGSWADASKWVGGIIPGTGVDDTATVNGNLSAAGTITLDSTQTLGTLALGDSSSSYFGFTLTNGTAGSLVLQSSSGTASILRAPGASTATDTISATTTLNSLLSASANTGTILLTGSVGGVGGVVRTAATGSTTGVFSLENVSNSYAGATSVQDGILQFRGSVLSGQNSALGNSTGAIILSTAASANIANTPVELRLVASDDSSSYTINRGLDLSGSTTNTGGNIVFRVFGNGAGGVNTNTINLSGPITLNANRNQRFFAQDQGMTLNLSGLITGGGTLTSTRSTFIGDNYSTASVDGVNGNATYRFSNASNSFGGNLVLDNGSVVIAGNVGALGTNSPIGIGGSQNVGFSFLGGAGQNIVGGFTGAGIGAASIRSVFMEAGGTTFARNLNPSGGRTAVNGTVYGTGTSINVVNGYEFGQSPTSATSVGSEVTWSGSITHFAQSVGDSNWSGFTSPNAMLIPGNFALFAPTGGLVNFTSTISEGSGSVVSTGSTSSGSSSAFRVTINQFRNNQYLDSNADGIADTGLAAGSNANDWIGTPTAGVVKLSSNTNTWTGSTDIRGGTLLANQNLTCGTINVNTGATLGGYGQIFAGTTGSTIEVSGSINPGDSTSSSVTTASGLSTAKKVNFNAGSNFTVDLNSASLNTSTASTAASYDRLSVSNTSGVSINATANITTNLGYTPLDGTVFQVLSLSASPATILLTDRFANVAQNGFLTATSGGVTYHLTANYNGGDGNDLAFTAEAPSMWAVDNDGTYNVVGNWTLGVPNGGNAPNYNTGAVAIFGNVATAPRTVTAGFANIDQIIFDDSSVGGGYILSIPGAFNAGSITALHGSAVIKDGTVFSAGSISASNTAQLTILGNISGAASLSVNDAAILTVGGTATYGGSTNVNGGTLDITGKLTGGGAITVNSNAANANLVLDGANAIPATSTVTLTGTTGFAPSLIVNSGQTLAKIVSSGVSNFTAGTSTVNSITGTGSVLVGSAATVTVNNVLTQSALNSAGTVNLAGSSSTVGTIDGTGTLSVTGTALTATYIRHGGLSVGSGSTVTIAHDNQSATGGTPTGTSAVTTLAVNAAGTLDLTNNGIVVTDTTQFGAIQSSLATAYAAGWASPGITSSTAAAHTGDHGVGYALASAIGSTSFNGITFADAVIARYTLLGDTNLKGGVDLGDYTKVITNLGKTGTVWSDGNFDYSGTVGLGDYTKVILALGRTDATAVNTTAGPSAKQVRAASSALTLKAAAPAVAPAATATDVHLVVNTASGLVTLISAVSGSQAIITAYTVKSPSGSLVKFKNSGSKYLGSAFQNNPGVFYSSSNGNTYNNWTGIKNTSTIIGEGFGNNYIATNDTTWTNYTLSSGGYALGAMFKTLSAGGVQDLSFQWDDKALNTFTSVVDYVGGTVPEPTSVSLIAMGAVGLLGRRRRRSLSK